jgi:uncharacterized membrane protein
MATPPFQGDQSLFTSDQPAALPATSSGNITSPTASTKKLILPSAYHDDRRSLKTIDRHDSTSFGAYLKHDLNVQRLNKVHKHLWLAGLPQISRTLHSHIMIGRQVLLSERADLHLIWQANSLYLKPLPDYLMDHSIWRDFLCNDLSLYQDANGFLYSYMCLICHKSDLKIAHDLGLLSKEIDWQQWTAFSKVVLSHLDYAGLRNISCRYLYGELRLARLNMIYRFCSKTTSLRTFIRGYQYTYREYSTFLHRNFAWVLTAIVYITIVLTAMQVGLATNELKDDDRFHHASYGFTVFSIVAPLILVFVVVVLLLALVVFNLCYTLGERSKARHTYQSIFANPELEKFKH